MGKGRSTKKSDIKLTKTKVTGNVKSRKKSVHKRRTVNRNESQLSYKESHSIGRRHSSNVPTYNESGWLYYDLYVKYGLNNSVSKGEQKLLKEPNHYVVFNSDASDTTTVACNDVADHSTGKRKAASKKGRKARKKTYISTDVSDSPAVYTRREASLNAEAKVNMLFESSKEGRTKRRSLPIFSTTEAKPQVANSVGENSGRVSYRARPSRLRVSDPSPSYSPPRKRLAGLNATAIISAFMKSPNSAPSPDAKPRQRRAKSSKTSSYETTGQKDSLLNEDERSRCVASCSSSPQEQNNSNSVTTITTVNNGSKISSASVVPTVERFQSHKVISYGAKCIGVENISRQIIHVPSQNQSLPNSSCSSLAPQRPFSPPFVSTPSRAIPPVVTTNNVSAQQNHSMVILPDTSFSSPPRPELFLPADVHTCFPGQFYVSPFGHSPVLQPHTFLMSPTLIHSMPPPPFHFLHTSPFTTTYMHSPSPMPTNYMLPMSVSPVYNTFSNGGFGGYIIPRPLLSTQPVQQPPPTAPAPPQSSTSLCAGGDSVVHTKHVYEPPKRVDRAVSPMPEIKIESAPCPACTTQVKKTSSRRVSIEKKQAPCLWIWNGTPTERLVFIKPDSPPVSRMCYPSMRHQNDGMVVCPGDNVLLCSGPDRHSAPHVAKVTALFNNPDNSKEGTKMMALLWYYRPESLTPPRRSGVVECELFASRHCDVNPVDCIDDRAYVLSADPYARFMALAKYKQESRTHRRPTSVVPRLSTAAPLDAGTTSGSTQYSTPDISEFPEDATPSNVFLCRAWYDFRSRRIIRHLKSLTNENSSNGSDNISVGHSTVKQSQQKQPDVLSLAQSSNNASSPTPSAPSTSPLPPPGILHTKEGAAPEEGAVEAPLAEAEEEIPNGRLILETSADLSINWGDHGEQIALALRSTPITPPSKKSDKSLKPSPPDAVPTSAPEASPTSPQPSHTFLSS